MLNGDASSHPFHSLPPPPPPPPHSHQTLFSSFGYHRLSPSSADEPRYGQGSSPLASCSPWIFLSFPLKRVSFSLCSACPPLGGLQGVCVCACSVCMRLHACSGGHTGGTLVPSLPRTPAPAPLCAQGTGQPPHPAVPTFLAGCVGTPKELTALCQGRAGSTVSQLCATGTGTLCQPEPPCRAQL